MRTIGKISGIDWLFADQFRHSEQLDVEASCVYGFAFEIRPKKRYFWLTVCGTTIVLGNMICSFRVWVFTQVSNGVVFRSKRESQWQVAFTMDESDCSGMRQQGVPFCGD